MIVKESIPDKLGEVIRDLVYPPDAPDGRTREIEVEGYSIKVTRELASINHDSQIRIEVQSEEAESAVRKWFGHQDLEGKHAIDGFQTIVHDERITLSMPRPRLMTESLSEQ